MRSYRPEPPVISLSIYEPHRQEQEFSTISHAASPRQIYTMEKLAPSAATTTFGTQELLELIIVQLSAREMLTNANRVCRAWHDTISMNPSTAIRRILFLPTPHAIAIEPDLWVAGTGDRTHCECVQAYSTMVKGNPLFQFGMWSRSYASYCHPHKQKGHGLCTPDEDSCPSHDHEAPMESIPKDEDLGTNPYKSLKRNEALSSLKNEVSCRWLGICSC